MSEKKTNMKNTRENAVRPRIARRAALALGLIAVAMGLFAAGASASQAISEFSIVSTTQQAGGHPDIVSRLRLDKPGQPEVAKNITVNLPQGIFGNPGAVFRCRASIFVINHCQSGAQVGTITVIANYEGNENFVLGAAPVYNMETIGEDEAARLAFVVPTINVPVAVPINIRSDGDFGLQLSINSISQSLALTSATLSLWGFPAAAEHDSERFFPGGPGEPPGCPGATSANCLSAPYAQAGILVRPYHRQPERLQRRRTACQPLGCHLPGPDAEPRRSDLPCHDRLRKPEVRPGLQPGLTSEEADAPSGLDIQLKADQFLAGEAPSPSTLRAATLTLPEGISINPDAADGQTSCEDIAQAHFGTMLPGECPDNSKIGTVEVLTPALDHPLEGSLYIGQPKPGDQYRVFMIFDGEGIHAKLVVDIHPDPATGQLTMSLDDIPQVPFETFNLHLFASDRGLVATPARCTIAGASSSLVPWNPTLAAQLSSPVVSVSSGPHGAECPGQVRPFHPRLVAGTSLPVAGDFSDFHLKLDRDDGDQFLRDITFRMPPGFSGDLRGISYCSEAQIAAATQNAGLAEQANGSCPAASQIGTTNVAAGPGGHPFHAVGRMYLAGPFKGAPLSVVAVTPALAGPYDYGVVVVRVALHIDPETAQVFAASDTVPSIVGGIPIRLRSIQVNLERRDAAGAPNFTLNPTNCSPFTVASQGIGDEGTVTDFSSFFQVVNCTRLPFKPKLTVRQTGGRKGTRRAANPTLQFDLRHASRRRQRQVALGDALERLRDRPGTPRQHLHRERTRGDPVRRPPEDRRGVDDDPAARPAPLGPRLRGLGLRRSASPRLHPQRPGRPVAAGGNQDRLRQSPADDRAGRPGCPDRPLPPDDLRRQARLSREHPRPLPPKGSDRRRLQRPERKDSELEHADRHQLPEGCASQHTALIYETPPEDSSLVRVLRRRLPWAPCKRAGSLTAAWLQELCLGK